MSPLFSPNGAKQTGRTVKNPDLRRLLDRGDAATCHVLPAEHRMLRTVTRVFFNIAAVVSLMLFALEAISLPVPYPPFVVVDGKNKVIVGRGKITVTLSGDAAVTKWLDASELSRPLVVRISGILRFRCDQVGVIKDDGTEAPFECIFDLWASPVAVLLITAVLPALWLCRMRRKLKQAGFPVENENWASPNPVRHKDCIRSRYN